MIDSAFKRSRTLRSLSVKTVNDKGRTRASFAPLQAYDFLRAEGLRRWLILSELVPWRVERRSRNRSLGAIGKVKVGGFALGVLYVH